MLIEDEKPLTNKNKSINDWMYLMLKKKYFQRFEYLGSRHLFSKKLNSLFFYSP